MEEMLNRCMATSRTSHPTSEWHLAGKITKNRSCKIKQLHGFHEYKSKLERERALEEFIGSDAFFILYFMLGKKVDYFDSYWDAFTITTSSI